MIVAVAAMLTAATLFGGMMLYSFGFAPLMFHVLPAEAAGRMLRRAFPFYYLFVIGAAAVAAALAAAADPLSAGLLAAVFAIGLVARQALMPAINAARDRFIGGDDRAKQRFDMLHGLSVAANSAQLGLVGWALVRIALGA